VDNHYFKTIYLIVVVEIRSSIIVVEVILVNLHSQQFLYFISFNMMATMIIYVGFSNLIFRL